MMKKIVSFVLFVLSLCSSSAVAQSNWDTYSDTWVTVDELGRKVRTSDDGLSGQKDNKTLGIFYYLWFGPHGTDGRPIFNISEMLQNPDNITWGNSGEFHWWSEPVLNYYVNTDSYVYDKHLQMLADAGVDFLFLDITNAFTYDAAVQSLMDAIDRRVANAGKTPKLCFMIHSAGETTLTHVYEKFYKDPLKDKYWFCYDGKPLILVNPGDTTAMRTTWDQDMVNHFTFRYSWAWMASKPNCWSWLEYAPQKYGYSKVSIPEQMSVGVAQHATTKIGRSYHNKKEPAINKYALCDSTAYGLYFEEQWKQAHSVDPPLIMVTQFNEWIAQRFVISSTSQYGNVRPGTTAAIGESYFVDEYNAEFSRDIEPSLHPLIRDNYYMQFVSHARQYKGVRSIPTPSPSTTIDLNGDTAQWEGVLPEFRDDIGDISHRNTAGYQNMAAVVNETGRNDIVVAKVTKDASNMYFYVRTKRNLTNFYLSKNWMILLLNTDTNYSTGWSGYDYCVRKDSVTHKYSLCKNIENKYKWEKIAEVTYVVSGNKLSISIPKSSLGLFIDCDIDFKWADNIPDYPDVLDFYTYGDVAPNARFNYRYKGSSIVSSVNPSPYKSDCFSATISMNKELSLNYTLSSPANVAFYIYDMEGMLLKQIPPFYSETGMHSIDSSDIVTDRHCVYLIKAILGEKSVFQKVLL